MGSAENIYVCIGVCFCLCGFWVGFLLEYGINELNIGLEYQQDSVKTTCQISRIESSDCSYDCSGFDDVTYCNGASNTYYAVPLIQCNGIELKLRHRNKYLKRRNEPECPTSINYALGQEIDCWVLNCDELSAEQIETGEFIDQDHQNMVKQGMICTSLAGTLILILCLSCCLLMVNWIVSDQKVSQKINSNKSDQCDEGEKAELEPLDITIASDSTANRSEMKHHNNI